ARAGPLGLLLRLVGRFCGARVVILSDPVAGRRELAARVGATGAIDPGREEVAGAFERLAGGAPVRIFECVGLPGMLRHCIGWAAPDATLVAAGVCMETDPILPLVANVKDLVVRFVAYYGREDFALTLDMLR